MTILELREKRAKAWEAAKAFLDSHRTDKGVLSAEDDAAYTRMEQEITDLGKEIARLERQEALEAELNRPVNKPLTGKPMNGKEDTKTGRAADEYRRNFWNMMRSKAPMPAVLNALQIGTDSEGGYLVPDEYERTLVEALEEENVFRQLAKVIQTSSGDRKIPVVASKGTASWIDEEGAYIESDDSFGQVSIGAYKLGTMIKVSEELLNDSVFDLESYISREFARRIGAKEEEAFFTGDGSGKPLGILAASGGAETGITAASATAITADELIDLFREDKFTRLPVYQETKDNVVGTINMKDLLLYDNKKSEFQIKDILREAYFTYEYKSISELLVEMRQASFNIAIVLDEYGETSGLITLEDILEEIVGEIHDEYDENEEENIKAVGEHEYIIEGSTNLDDLNDSLELNLESEDYDSLGGFIIEKLDRLPKAGDSVVTEDGIRMVVEKLDKNRIETVHLYLPENYREHPSDSSENDD